MKRKVSIGLLAVAAVVALLAAVRVQAEPAQAVPPSQASQPMVYAQHCSQSKPGTVQVVFLWNPSHQGQQWLDLSLLNNGFAPGTFVSAGPLPRDRWGFMWDGLLPGLTHYIRVNTLTPTGWVSSRTTTLVTGVCPPPVATLGTPTQECSSQQPGRVKVTFKWTPGASTGTTQYLDLSTFNNGFTPATFISAGPLAAHANSLVWDGLQPSTTHYWRVNTLGGSGWHPSATGSFSTGLCGPGAPTPGPAPTATPEAGPAQQATIDQWSACNDTWVAGGQVELAIAMSKLQLADTSYLERQYQLFQGYLSANCVGIGARLASIPGIGEAWCFDMLTLGSIISVGIPLANLALGTDSYFLDFAKREVDGFLAAAGCWA